MKSPTALLFCQCLLLIGVSLGLSVPAMAADPFLRRTATVEAVDRVGPAVVSITTSRAAAQNPFRNFPNDARYQRFQKDFGRHQQPDLELGSGVIIDPSGHVLTNEHVISRASQLRVRLADGRSFDANIVGADPNNDLAVLAIEMEKGSDVLPWVPPGRSDDLLVGEPVIAIGSPFGFSNTVTTGVISALDRSFHTQQQPFHGFIQTDASINPGNSGGPLLNAEGSLIGINSAIYNGAQGIGFAIPIGVAMRVVSELIEHGEVTPIWLGMEFKELDPALYAVLSVPIGRRGVLISMVRPGSPAERAGMTRGDVLLRIDGRNGGDAPGVLDYLETVLVGQDLEVEVWRDRESKVLTLRSEEIPAEHVHLLAREYLGLDLGEGGKGYRVTGVEKGSRAARIGFRVGDRLVALNGHPLDGSEDLRRAIVELRSRRLAVVVVQRGAGRYHVTIPLV